MLFGFSVIQACKDCINGIDFNARVHNCIYPEKLVNLFIFRFYASWFHAKMAMLTSLFCSVKTYYLLSLPHSVMGRN